jgi:hypothetical protein
MQGRVLLMMDCRAHQQERSRYGKSVKSISGANIGFSFNPLKE